MAEIVIVLCYINGSIVNGPCGIEYNGRPQKAIRIKNGMKYEELKDKFYKIFRVDRRRNKIIIIYGYPQVCNCQ